MNLQNNLIVPPKFHVFLHQPIPLQKIPDIYKIAYDLSMSSCILWLYPHQIPRGGDMVGQELLPSPGWVRKTKTSWVNDSTKIIWWVSSKRKTGTPLGCYTPASAVCPVPHSAAFLAGPRRFHECTQSPHWAHPLPIWPYTPTHHGSFHTPLLLLELTLTGAGLSRI